jgi:hypothetical protein
MQKYDKIFNLKNFFIYFFYLRRRKKVTVLIGQNNIR